MKDKLILYIILTICSALTVNADILISAILYDPVGADTGNEWVEFYNPTNESIDLTNYSLFSGNGANEQDWEQVWNGSEKQLAPHTFYCIAEKNISYCDQISILALQNGPDGIKLAKNNQTIEVIGWGSLNRSEYFEGAPAQDVSSAALTRTYELENDVFIFSQTHNNANDFVELKTYTPKNSFFNYTLAQVLNETARNISYYVQIENKPPRVGEIEILHPDVSIIAGKQILLLNNTLSFSCLLEDANSLADIRELEISVKKGSKTVVTDTITLNVSNATRELTSAYVNLTHQLSKTLDVGSYEFWLIASDEFSISETAGSLFSVEAMLGYQISKTLLALQQYDDIFTDNFSVANTGNTPLRFLASMSNLTGSKGEIALLNATWNWTKDSDKITNTLQVIDLALAPGENVTVQVFVQVPLAVRSGSYGGYVQLVAEENT